MENESYKWHFDYTRLAWESGFTFESYKSRKTFDRNKIALLDIDRIIRERDIAIVESYLENILDFNLDNDELKILDHSFVKLFNLYRLSVEFLMYCKKFLDKTVVALKNDLRKNVEDNDFYQKEMARIMSENNRLKKKIKDLKLTLHYQQRFQKNLDDQITIFQCNVCNKTFLNNEYLNAHLKRRHNIEEKADKENILQESEENTPHTTPEHEKYKTETDRLQSEIKLLKEKLNNTERYFNTDNGNLSPGNVKIQTNPISESFRDIQELQKQFETLKNTVQTELNLIKTQKLAQESQETLLQKFIDKLDSKNVQTSLQLDINEHRNSYVQTDELDLAALKLPVTVHEPKAKDVDNVKRRQGFQKRDKGASSFIKTVESSTESETKDEERPDVRLDQEEVERKLEEKTKREIEVLGEQLSKKMATSFNFLEERMETFLNKFNEKTSLISETPSPIPAYVEKAPINEATKVSPEKPPITKSKSFQQIDSPPKLLTQPSSIKVSSESDSVSETESNQHLYSDNEISEEEKPMPLPRKDTTTQKLMDELKTKVQERKIISESKQEGSDDQRKKKPTKIFISTEKVVEKPKLERLGTIQKPVVTKMFSKPVKSLPESETSSESESESSSEEEEEEEKPVKKENKVLAKDKIKKETPIQRQFLKRSHSTPLKPLRPQSREEILDDINICLEKLGVDPESKTLQNKDYKEKSERLLKERDTTEKKSQNSFVKIRNQIVQDIETKIKSISNPNLLKNQPEISPKPSRFKTMMSSVKSKLLSMKTEKSPTKSTPVYKLTVHQDSPDETSDQEKEVTPVPPKKLIKEKNPVKREKIIIKPKKMYVDSESESAKSDDEVLKKERGTELKNSARKSISVTSLNERDKKGSVQNIAQSLDSILEMKKEIIAEINKEKSQEMLKNFSSSEESISPPKYAGKLTYEIPEMKTDVIQKSVLKNYPSASSLVKKKVIFDLENESDNEKSDIQNEISEPKKVKTNSFFNFDMKDDDSTSATSSVFDGSKLNLNQLEPEMGKEKISTKAQINVPSKKIERKDSESDFDISDLL